MPGIEPADSILVLQFVSEVSTSLLPFGATSLKMTDLSVRRVKCSADPDDSFAAEQDFASTRGSEAFPAILGRSARKSAVQRLTYLGGGQLVMEEDYANVQSMR